jgi:hypothetical protein
VANSGGADSMLWFQLERGGDEMKCYQKMKQRQRARLSSMGRKHDTARWHGDVGRRRCSTGEGKGGDDASWALVNITGLKNEENIRRRFSWYK